MVIQKAVLENRSVFGRLRPLVPGLKVAFRRNFFICYKSQYKLQVQYRYRFVLYLLFTQNLLSFAEL